MIVQATIDRRRAKSWSERTVYAVIKRSGSERFSKCCKDRILSFWKGPVVSQSIRTNDDCSSIPSVSAAPPLSRALQVPRKSSAIDQGGLFYRLFIRSVTCSSLIGCNINRLQETQSWRNLLVDAWSNSRRGFEPLLQSIFVSSAMRWHELQLLRQAPARSLIGYSAP